MESSLEVDDYHKDSHDDNDNDTDSDSDNDNDNDNGSDIIATTMQTKMKPAWQTMPTQQQAMRVTSTMAMAMTFQL